MSNSSHFLYSRNPNLPNDFLEDLAFNINLQEFIDKVNYICDLQTDGKLSLEAAYAQIRELWKDHYEQIQLVLEKKRFCTKTSAL